MGIYAPGSQILCHYMVNKEGMDPDDFGWRMVDEDHSALVRERNLDGVVETAKNIVSQTFLKAGNFSPRMLYGYEDDFMDEFFKFRDISYSVYTSLEDRTSAMYKSIVEFHYSINADDPILGHLAGKEYEDLSDDEMCEELLYIAPFFEVLGVHLGEIEPFEYGSFDPEKGILDKLREYRTNELSRKDENVAFLTNERKDIKEDISGEDAAFQGIEYSVEDGKVIIQKYNGDDDHLVIPKTIDGVPVKVVKKLGIFANKNVNKLTICGDLEMIDNAAFSCFESLWDATFLGKIDWVGAHIFANTFVRKTIEYGVEYYAVNENPYYMVNSYKTCGNNVVNLEKGTKIICKNAFITSGIEFINMPDVETIGERAFASCENLKVVNLSQKLRYLGEGAFSNCSKLEEIFVNAETIPTHAFAFCDRLKTIKFGADVKKIEEEAFFYSDLREFVLPESIQEFSTNLFGMDSILKELYLPGNRKWKDVTTGVIYEAETMMVPEAAANVVASNPDSTLVVIGESEKHDKVSELEAKKMGLDMWEHFSTGEYLLNSLDADPEMFIMPKYVGGREVEAIGASAIMDKKNLKGVFLCGSWNKIGAHFLSDCENVRFVNIEGTVNTIGRGCFDNCKHLLTTVNGVTYGNINGNPYYVVVSVDKDKTKVIVNEDAVVVSMYAFEESKVEVVTLPNVAFVAKGAFCECKSLKEIGASRKCVFDDGWNYNSANGVKIVRW